MYLLKKKKRIFFFFASACNILHSMTKDKLYQGSYRNMKTKFQDFSRIFFSFQGLNFIHFKSIFDCFCRKRRLPETGCTSFLSPEYFHRGIDKYRNYRLTESEHRAPSHSSTNPAIFTQFSFAHHINPKEWKRIGVFYYFQGQFHIFKGNFTIFQDKWHYFEIPGVFQDQGQIQGLFQVCANPVYY